MTDDLTRNVCALAEAATALSKSSRSDGGITATSEISQPGLGNLLACSMMQPGTIEAMEKAGQAEVAAQKSKLPRQGVIGKGDVWKALGFEICGLDETDDLWVNVVMPPGWKIVPADHSMWSYLVDDKGRKRGGLFYKAAFYDRSAHISLNTRFSYSAYGDEDWREDGTCRARVTDAGSSESPFVTEWIEAAGRPGYEVSDEAHKIAESWLDENYPDWGNVAAYWD